MKQKHSTIHRVCRGDARRLNFIERESIHLVLCSPPYFNIKDYSDSNDQLGNTVDYEDFLAQLKRVWTECHRVLIPGGRAVIVVGDICVARKSAEKRHYVLPLHSSIQVSAMHSGFDCLTPIIWRKSTNASYEGRNSARVYGKPWQPNAIVKNGIEYILVLRKPGPYRSPSAQQREDSMLSRDDYYEYFQPIWNIPGASNPKHPAVFPEQIATRLVRMYSFVDDYVLDPFGGSGTTSLACLKTGRNSIYVDVNPDYCRMSLERLTTCKGKDSLSARIYVKGF